MTAYPVSNSYRRIPTNEEIIKAVNDEFFRDAASDQLVLSARRFLRLCAEAKLPLQEQQKLYVQMGKTDVKLRSVLIGEGGVTLVWKINLKGKKTEYQMLISNTFYADNLDLLI